MEDSLVLKQAQGLKLDERSLILEPDGNSFCGDVVLDNFNKVSQDENNILDQIV